MMVAFRQIGIISIWAREPSDIFDFSNRTLTHGWPCIPGEDTG